MSIKFLIFLERDFHIALLKPLMKYIHEHNLGTINIYAPFIQDIEKILKTNISFEVKITNDPWSYRPDITFMADFSYQYVEGLGKLVNIGHGTICKGWFYSDTKISQRENSADMLCVPGTIHKKRLEKQVFKPIVTTGMPKLDNCFNKTLNKAKLYEKFGLNPNRKTILIAPTFNEEFSILTYLRIYDLDRIFPENINLIVKLHGVSDPECINQFKELQGISTEPEFELPSMKSENATIDDNSEKRKSEISATEALRNVYIAESFDSDEIYFISDLLITDVSSVIYEFLSLDKPILLFDSPRQKNYINLNEKDLEWEYREVGHRFGDIERIPKLIEEAFKTDATTKAQDISQHFISVRDGSSTERVVKYALKLLTDAPPPEITVIYIKNNINLENRFSPQFPVIRSNRDNFFQAITEVIDDIKTEFVLFLHPAFEYSPQIANILLNHVKNNSDIGIVAPLIFDDQVHLQQVKFRVKMEDNLNFNQLAFKLNYAFAGNNRVIEYILPHCFLVRKSILNIQFTDPANRRLSMYELLANAQKNKFKILVAYDAIIQVTKGVEMVFLESDSIIQDEETSINQDDDTRDEIDVLNDQLELELKSMAEENPTDEETKLMLIR